MNCNLIETPLGNGKSEYSCLRCGRTDRMRSGLAHAKRMCLAPDGPQPGTELANLLKEIGVEPDNDCKCFRRAAAMDANGLDWCKSNKPIIVGWLYESAQESSWSQTFSVLNGLIGSPWFRPLKPFESIVDESIRRAETEHPHTLSTPSTSTAASTIR